MTTEPYKPECVYCHNNVFVSEVTGDKVKGILLCQGCGATFTYGEAWRAELKRYGDGTAFPKRPRTARALATARRVRIPIPGLLIKEEGKRNVPW